MAPSAASTCPTSATPIYRSLIAAHNALDDAEGKTGPRVALEVGDFNLDARQEVRLENDRLIALVRPAQGGHLYELDVRQNAINVLATLDRRPEAYHQAILEAIQPEASRDQAAGEAPASIHDRVVLKQEGLDRLLVYDRHPRKALVDHFYPIDVTLDDLAACRDVERGDFVTGTYLAKVQREPQAGGPGDGTARPGRRPRDPDQEDRSSWPPARRRSRSTTSFPTCPARRACTSPSRSTWPRWPATPTTATTPTPQGGQARDARRAPRPRRTPRESRSPTSGSTCPSA